MIELCEYPTGIIPNKNMSIRCQLPAKFHVGQRKYCTDHAQMVRENIRALIAHFDGLASVPRAIPV